MRVVRPGTSWRYGSLTRAADTGGPVNPQGVGTASLHTGRSSGRPCDRPAGVGKSALRSAGSTPWNTQGSQLLRRVRP